MTKAKIEARVASDADEADMVMDWANSTVESPQPKAVLNMRIDREVPDCFRRTGKGCPSRINAVLRSYVERREQPDRQK